MNAIGIRQGRLSPPPDRSLRRFPYDSWHGEFAHAQACGFDAIEWLFGADGHAVNPVWSDDGRLEIAGCVRATGVRVQSLCADYFIAHPLFRVSREARQHRAAVLMQLIAAAAQVGVTLIVLPVLEESAIESPADEDHLLEALSEPLENAMATGVHIALEADLRAADCVRLVERARCAALGICYDTGNAAATGADLADDLHLLAPHLLEVHIKDRQTNGGVSVPLGEGNADFDRFFAAAAAVGYSGPFVLETPPGDHPLESAASHLAFVRSRQ